MKKEVIKTAGKIWKTLREKDQLTITQLPRSLKVPSVVAYQALGWLAREDKIEYHKKGDKVLVSLTPTERPAHARYMSPVHQAASRGQRLAG